MAARYRRDRPYHASVTVLRLLCVAAGLALVSFTLADSLAALVVPRGLTSRWRPTRVFYKYSWMLWRAAVLKVRSAEKREQLLAIYAPMSLLTLLLLWLTRLVFAWSLVYLPFSADLDGANGYGGVFYFSGTSLLTLGFGDITATSTVLRVSTLLEAVTGLGTVALVISYLPALYGAYGRRETRLLTLDDPSGERIQPTSLIALHAPDGEVERLYRFFAEWELWTAEVLESHVSYPMLAFFRSQHPGQSWVSALGVVADAAAIVAAAVPGADRREPYFLYRRARQAMAEIALRLDLEVDDDALLDQERFDVAYGRLVELGLDLRPADEAWTRLREYRHGYGRTLESLIEFLLAPPGFWGHSAEDVEEELLEQPAPNST